MFDGFIADEHLFCLDLNEPFPEVGSDIDMVFDLAGLISKTALSIATAIKQSDVVLVPIYNEVKAIKAGLNTIAEVLELNKNVVVIATKLQKRNKNDIFTNWSKCEDMQNIQNAVHSQISPNIPVLPLKYSSVFDTIFEQEKSISQLMQAS
ncbi:hypothetical protein [Candidatus Thiodubiliella endoseptemdiera]|uniref:hypothetical protein n=1 Tax=Candidatus Thiodubiliella endoseptemdiera TaxID=2738886 RepID=UPI0034DF8EC5